jgi:peptidoglycan/xylan/chitin deacetylase (PgdA/CDA1 family)
MLMQEHTFARLLEHLAESWNVLSLDQFLEGTEAGLASGPPRCLLTFDDGWADNFATALPLLRSTGLPATVFLTVGYVEGKIFPWVEALSAVCNADDSLACRVQLGLGTADLHASIERLKHMPAADRAQVLQELLPARAAAPSTVDGMMTWEQVREMSAQGITFGGHSLTHSLLIYESDDTLEREVRGCRTVLEGKLGRKVRSFAYPNGDWDARVRAAVVRAGFDCAFATQSGWHSPDSDRFTIRRIMLHERNLTGVDGQFSPAAFNLTVSGWL